MRPKSEYNQEEMLRIATHAIEHPEEYKDNPKRLLNELAAHCGKTALELRDAGTASVLDAKYPGFEMLKKIIESNLFDLPEYIERNDKEKICTKDFIYELFGYFDKTDEKNILAKIQKVFDEEQQYPDIVSFLRRLAWANGMFGTNSGVKDVNENKLLKTLGYGPGSAFFFTSGDLSYDMLLCAVDPVKNPLRLYTGVSEETYHTRIDTLFKKVGMTHWRRDTLAANAERVMAPIREGATPPFYETVSKLLPQAYIERKALANRLGVSSSRAQRLMDGDAVFNERECAALLNVVHEQTGVQDSDISLLKTLDRKHKATGNVAFSAQLKEMLERYMYQDNNGQFNLIASCRDFAPLTGNGALHTRALKSETLRFIVRSPMNVTRVTVRSIITGFEALKRRHPDWGKAIDDDITKLLNTTRYTREQLFHTVEQVVAHFDEKEPWPMDAPNTRIGSLINEMRLANGMEIGHEELAAVSECSLSALNMYLISNVQPIPVKEAAHAKLPSHEKDNLDRLIEGFNKALQERNQNALSDESVAKIHRIGLKSYEEFMEHKSEILAANRKKRMQAHEGDGQGASRSAF